MELAEQGNDVSSEDFTLENLIGTLSKEIPRIINNSSSEINDNSSSETNNINDVLGMIETLENGEQPILLKIVQREATEEEILEWAESNGISTEETNDVLDMLVSSFTTGTNIAEQIESDISNQTVQINDILESIQESDNFDKNKVSAQLNSILDRLDSIQKEVSTLIENLNPIIP